MARVLVIFSLPLVCVLRRVFEQSVNSRAGTMLKYTRCSMVILVAATAWLMLCFSSCIVCGFDSHTVLFQCPQGLFLLLPLLLLLLLLLLPFSLSLSHRKKRRKEGRKERRKTKEGRKISSFSFFFFLLLHLLPLSFSLTQE